MFKRLLADGAKQGVILAAATATTVAAADYLENGAAWGAINSISHIVDGDRKEYGSTFSPRDSAIGLGINSFAMLVWGIIYIVLFGRLSMPKSLAAASLITGGAYVLDYHLVPKQYTPGIEKKISKKAIFFTYVVMAATLALSPAINRRKK